MTKNWLRQFVLALILICHSSFRGVIEILEAVFDYRNLTLGTVHNIVSQTVQKAQEINNAQELSGIHVGIADEIFQASKPVLVGMDAKPTYCYLLAREDHRDNLLAFVAVLDERFAEIAARFKVPLFVVYTVCELQGLNKNLPK